ncbi:MAG: ATP-binding protein [Flavobacteriales bacterium]
MASTIPFQGQKVQKLVKMIQELSLAKGLNGIMEVVRTNTRELSGADGVTFVLKEGDKSYYADEDAISPLWKGCRFPMSACISGWCMMNREVAVVEDIYQDPRIPYDVYRPTFVKSLVMVPIRSSAPVGAIGNYWADHHSPSEEEIEILRSLADATAVAMENVAVYNELDKKVRQRTAQLEAFSYSVAHDLKNPLAGMEMRLNSLEGGEQGQIREVTQDLYEAIERMKAMIDGLMELSKSGEEGIKKKRIDLKEQVEKVSERWKQEMNPGSGSVVRIGELPYEMVDPRLFERVWENLISNAIKFSKEEGALEIDIGVIDGQGERTYYVKDNGKGFPPEKGPELFKAFQRMDPDMKYEGTGIGLSLVQQIVLEHGGTIWAEGESGNGATFFISLPWSPERGATPSFSN